MAYIITSSWALMRFTEKDTSSKLEVLVLSCLCSAGLVFEESSLSRKQGVLTCMWYGTGCVAKISVSIGNISGC